MKIAICITTRNREKQYNLCIKNIIVFTPVDDIAIFSVDDNSDLDYRLAGFTFNERAGIPKAKNKCLELAYQWGADHIFLFDDDTYPIAEDWHLPYINSPYNHLCYTFNKEFNSLDDNHKTHSLGNGCMMYFKRICLDKVGGFDERYGLGKFEHVDLSRRIFNAGLTPHRFIDVIGSDKLLYCLDQDNAVERSFTDEESKQQLAKGFPIFLSNKKSSNFIPFY